MPTGRTTAASVGEPKRISLREQWDRLVGVLDTSIGAANAARDLHAKSAQQLDLATYALYSLAEELAGVMSEPLGRGTAVIHRLEPQIRRPRTDALAA